MEHRDSDCWTPLRKDLCERLKQKAPALGNLYEGAVCMMFSNHFPGRVHFVAHAVREICNRLPDIVTGREKRSRIEYKNELDKIQKSWERAGFPTDGSIPARVAQDIHALPREDVPVPAYLFQQIANLIRDHSSLSETKYQSAARLFKALDPNIRKSETILSRLVNSWLDNLDWFVGKVHVPAAEQRWKDAEILDELRQRFEEFEYALSAILREFFKTTEILDEILEEANS